LLVAVAVAEAAEVETARHVRAVTVLHVLVAAAEAVAEVK
jgi:hypothetical protein